eukprot:c20038_g1_i1 orf=388-1668(+)
MDSSGLRVGAVVGIVFGVMSGAFLVIAAVFCCLRAYRTRSSGCSSGELNRSLSLPMRTHGVGSSVVLSDAVTYYQNSSSLVTFGAFLSWWRSFEDPRSATNPRIMKFAFRDLEKATNKFTTVLGKGAYGPVYKAVLPCGITIAVKVLATNSKQGEKEFHNEVMLLGRLHHKNLLNLAGFCAERGHRILAYEYMSNGSLAIRLYDEHYEPLNWEQRVSIAQDVARGIEYLHDGAVPAVIHRDIKSTNILLDSLMTARVADFGLSKEADPDMPASGVRGTYGYIDPEYVSTNRLTDKSDVYSFGVLIFELIAAKSPQEGLLDYVNLVIMGKEQKKGWLEMLDSRLNGRCNVDELEELVSIASKCIEREPRNRPRMRHVAQALSRLGPKSESSRINLQRLPSIGKIVANDLEFPLVMSNRAPSRLDVKS